MVMTKLESGDDYNKCFVGASISLAKHQNFSALTNDEDSLTFYITQIRSNVFRFSNSYLRGLCFEHYATREEEAT